MTNLTDENKLARKTFTAIEAAYQTGVSKMFDECIAAICTSDDPALSAVQSKLLTLLKDKRQESEHNIRAVIEIFNTVY